MLDATALIALQGMQEAHSAKLWAKVAVLGDAWIDARGELPVPAAILFAESLMVVGRIEEALLWSSKADDALSTLDGILKVAALTTLGRALSRSGQYTPSQKVLAEAAKIPCTDDETLEKQGHIVLAVSRKWRRGWRLHEARLTTEDRKLPPNMHQWNGTSPGPVRVLHEQGIGDAVLAARWLPWLAEKTGFPVRYYGPTLMHRWIGALPGVELGDLAADLTVEEPVQAIRAMSLPFVARCDGPDEVPPPVAPGELLFLRDDIWRKDTPFTVGVCWKGSDQGWHDYERSYKPEDFAPIWESFPGVRFVSVCHDEPAPDGAPFDKQVFTDAYHTGEVVAGCHMIVTVDTAVAHIAGSLGVPTICLVPTVADWRYAWPYGNSTPWYPSLTVLRRPTAYSLAMIPRARDLMERFAAQVNAGEVQ